MLFLLISRMLIYIFQLLSITIMFTFSLTIQTLSVEGFAIWDTAPRVFTSLIKPTQHFFFFFYDYVWIQWTHLYLYNQIAWDTAVGSMFVTKETCYSLSVLSFLCKTTFCANGHAQLCLLCHVIQRNTLNVYHSPAHLFLSFSLCIPAQCQLWRLSQMHQSPVPLEFVLPDVVITTDASPNHWAFYFQVSRFPLSCSVTWSGFRCKFHIALHSPWLLC